MRRRGSAILFVLVIVAALTTVWIAAGRFSTRCILDENRRESDETARETLSGAIEKLKADYSAGNLLLPASVTTTIGTGTSVMNVTANGSSIPHTMTVTAVTTVGHRTYKTTSIVGMPNPPGLFGEYYSNYPSSSTAFPTGAPTAKRFDATVNFNWNAGSPITGVPATHFCAQWTGYLTPIATGACTIYTTSDDGVRVWVKGVEVINNWTTHGSTVNSGTVSLTSGVRVPIIVQYFQTTSSDLISLSWSYPSITKAIIASAYLSPN